jgi:hypothetical protein
MERRRAPERTAHFPLQPLDKSALPRTVGAQDCDDKPRGIPPPLPDASEFRNPVSDRVQRVLPNPLAFENPFERTQIAFQRLPLP